MNHSTMLALANKDRSLLPGRLSNLTIPESIANQEDKRFFFSIDTYFREAMTDFDLVGVEEAIGLDRLTSVVFLPEAIVARKVGLAVEFLEENLFRPIAFAPFRFNRHMIRENWRYQYNAAIQDRIDAADELRTATESIFVLLLDTSGAPSASARLKLLKGPSDPTLRKSGDLRFVLGDFCYLLSIVHTPDEVSDLVREFGVFFSGAERIQILREALAKATKQDSLLKQAELLYAIYPERRLCWADSLARIRSAFLLVAVDLSHEERTAWLVTLEEFGKRQTTKWQPFFCCLDSLGGVYDVWDKYVVVANLFDKNNANLDGISRVIG